MIFAEFLVNTHSWDGTFKYVGRDWATPSHAFTAAHDMFEHAPNDKGTLEDEMMALGAAVFLRTAIVGEGSARSVAHVAGGDIFGHVLKPMTNPKLRKCNYNLAKLPVDLSIKFDELFASRKDHWEDCPHDLATSALRWAKYGCIKAMARFAGCNNVQAIYRNVHELLKRIKWEKNGHGRLTIAVDPKTGDIDHEWVAA